MSDWTNETLSGRGIVEINFAIYLPTLYDIERMMGIAHAESLAYGK